MKSAGSRTRKQNTSKPQSRTSYHESHAANVFRSCPTRRFRRAMATPNRGMTNPKMILVAVPYRSGTNDDPTLIAKNVEAMTEASLQLFRAGHLPVMGEWYALPLIEHAGSTGIG